MFTNIPLDETIDICTYTICSQLDLTGRITKEEFKNLLSLATKESYFIFNEVLYKQKDGVGMSFPLGLILAYVFLCFYEKNDLKNALLNLSHFFVEDMLMIISKSFVTTLKLVTGICPFRLRKKKTLKCPF